MGSENLLKIIANPVGAVISGVGSALVNSHSSSKAAETSNKAAQDVLTENRRIYDEEKARRQPFVDASTMALGKLGDINAAGKTMALPPSFQSPYAVPTNGGMGTRPPQMGQVPPLGAPAPQMPPQQAPQMGAPTPGLVTVESQDGRRAKIPQSQLQQALSRGLRQVG